MKPLAFIPFGFGLAVIAFGGCAAQQDPAVQAAVDFQQTAMDLIEQDRQKGARLASLRLGMTDEQVLTEVGPPSRRDSLGTGETTTEVWTYTGELKSLGTLTFEDGKLVQVRVL